MNVDDCKLPLGGGLEGWQTSFFDFLRLLLGFQTNPVKLDGKWKKETAFAHIVVGVQFEGLIIVFLLKYKQKTKKDEPEKTKKGLRLSSSFRVRLSSFFSYS